jgi:hypothetical protein
VNANTGVKVCMCGSGLHYNFGAKKCEQFEVKLMNPETKAEIDLGSDPAHQVIEQLPEIKSFK